MIAKPDFGAIKLILRPFGHVIIINPIGVSI